MKMLEVRELETYAEATQNTWWVDAMKEEMQALVENDTWELVRPFG